MSSVYSFALCLICESEYRPCTNLVGFQWSLDNCSMLVRLAWMPPPTLVLLLLVTTANGPSNKICTPTDNNNVQPISVEAEQSIANSGIVLPKSSKYVLGMRILQNRLHKRASLATCISPWIARQPKRAERSTGIDCNAAGCFRRSLLRHYRNRLLSTNSLQKENAKETVNSCLVQTSRAISDGLRDFFP